MPRSRNTLITLAIIVAAAVAIFSLLPMVGYDSDITKVGEGTPAVVLAFENYAPATMDAMEILNRVRRDYGDELHFLVADLGTPRGRAFVDRHGAFPGLVLTFRSDGSRAGAGMIETEADFRERLQRELGL